MICEIFMDPEQYFYPKLSTFIDKNGNVWASDGDGIGVELNWDWINSHKIGQEIFAEK